MSFLGSTLIYLAIGRKRALQMKDETREVLNDSKQGGERGERSQTDRSTS